MLKVKSVHDSRLGFSRSIDVFRSRYEFNPFLRNWRDDRRVVPNFERTAPTLQRAFTFMFGTGQRPSLQIHNQRSTFNSPWYGQSSTFVTSLARTGFSTTYCHF